MFALLFIYIGVVFTLRT